MISYEGSVGDAIFFTGISGIVAAICLYHFIHLLKDRTDASTSEMMYMRD